jgi:uncharacterized protein YjcR
MLKYNHLNLFRILKMTTSLAQISANRANALKSTGAITQAGKAKVSQNAITHGLFSKQVLLADENPLEYQLLLEQLQQELLPVGILEQSLVERVAISLWKQKRLVRAETARLNLERQTQKLVNAVNSELNLSFSSRAISEQDLTNEIDETQLEHCVAVLREYETLNLSESFDVAQIEARLPTIFQELCIGAKLNAVTPEDYLRKYESATAFFNHVVCYCRDELQRFERKQLALTVAKLIKDKRAILSEKSRDSLAKYQVMLDNELYKVIKALREAQTWRIDMLPAANGQNYSLN